MSMEQTLLETLRSLSPEQTVLDFAQFLLHKYGPQTSRPSVKGLQADPECQITEDIVKARQDMGGDR